MDDYHGRTELGVGEHDLMKKRLQDERHREYQEYIAKKYGEPMPVWEPQVEEVVPVQSDEHVNSDGEVDEVDEEWDAKKAGMQSTLKDMTKAEYDEAMREDEGCPESSQTDDQNSAAESTHKNMTSHERVCAEAQENASNQDEESLSGVFGGESTWWQGTEERRRQRQQNYANDLEEQIAEQKNSKQIKKLKDEADDRKRDVERAAHGSYECGSYSGQ